MLKSHRNGTLIHPHEIPSSQQATDDYRQQDGTLSDPEPFGYDPLANNVIVIGQRDVFF